jgi:ATP-binding cassette subfamily B protein AbcA/BmrA
MWTSAKSVQGSHYKVSDIIYEEGESLDDYVKEITESGDILFDNVNFAYDKKPVIENASFTIPKGKATMLIGHSGAGKSTVLKLLERLYEPDSGRILTEGTDIGELSLRQWRSRVAYVSQSTPLFSGSIRDNLLYGITRDVSDEEIAKACRMSRLSGFIGQLEEGLDYEVGQFGEHLSGGQRQKISVARALLSDADILILDEPTASLDITSTQEITETIEMLKGKRTVIAVTHDPDVIKHGDHIIVINSDHTIDEGSGREMMRISDFYREIMRERSGEH